MKARIQIHKTKNQSTKTARLTKEEQTSTAEHIALHFQNITKQLDRADKATDLARCHLMLLETKWSQLGQAQKNGGTTWKH